MSEYVRRACFNECLGDIWVWVRVDVNCFFIILSALSCFYHTRWAQFPLSANKIASYLLRSLSSALFLLAVINVKHSVQFLFLCVNVVLCLGNSFFFFFSKIRAHHTKHPETMTPMRPLAHLPLSYQRDYMKSDLLSSHDSPVLSRFSEVKISASRWCQMMIWYPVIPQRTDFMAQFLASLLRTYFILTQTTSPKQ